MIGDSEQILAVGQVFQQRYAIQRVLSTGGYGVVYEAEQLATGQKVAVKCLRRLGSVSDDGRRLKRFEREVRLCATLHHPNIVRLIDSGRVVGHAGEELYAVFEFVPGRNLAEVLATERQLKPVEAGRLMGQVLDALSCAHDVGIVHRDLKPANIMVVPTGARRNATVLDFGIGGFTRDAARMDEQTLTATQERVGTPAYSAPEQLRGHDPSAAADIYAWGLVFLECLTGERAISGLTVAEVMHQQLREAPVYIPRGLAAHPLGELLRRATIKDEKRRTLRARALMSALEACDLRSVSLPSLDDMARTTAGATRTVGDATGFGDAAARGGLASLPGVDIASPSGLGGPSLVGSEDTLVSMGSITGPRRERRQVTVVSCTVNIVAGDSTPLDIEDQEELLGEEVRFCREVAGRMDGHLDASDPIRVVLYYGYPKARGNDAQRAVQDASTIAAEFAARSAQRMRSRGVRIDVQIGVHSGLVIINEMPAGMTSIVGAAVRMAAELEVHAQANGVVVSADTHALVRGHFSFGDQRNVAVRGQTGPLAVYPLTGVLWQGEAALTTTVEGAAAPMVGRSEELGALQQYWQTAHDGRGRAIQIIGDAGIGKSRLLHEFGRDVRSPSMNWLQCRCSPDNANSVLRPVVDMFRGHLGIRSDTESGEARRHLEALVIRCGLDTEDAMPLLAPLFGVPLAAGTAPPAMAPAQQRAMLLRALLLLFVEMAAERPLVLAIEDVHWIDATTLELVRMLLDELESAPVLMILTSRPERDHGLSVSATLRLDRLNATALSEMVQRCAGGKSLPEAVIDEVLRRSDGVPLFVEELIRTILASGVMDEHETEYTLDGKLSDLAIPATLRELLTARLDRLGAPARSLAQLAAVLGREFRYDTLQVLVRGGDDNALRALLDELVASGLLYRRRRLRSDSYVFKHALIHDAAYDTLPQKRRRELHAHVAATLAAELPVFVKERPEILAHHHASAGEIVEACDYARQAAMAALMQSANAEAAGYSWEAIAWLDKLPDDDSRAELQLGFLGILAPALLGTSGHGDDAFGEVAKRAKELLPRLGDSEQARFLIWMLWIREYSRANYGEGLALAEEYAARAERQEGDEARLTGYSSVSSTLCYLGRFAESAAAAETVCDIYDPERHGMHWMSTGHDARVTALGLWAWCEWQMGQPAAAFAHISEARGYADAAAQAAVVTRCFVRFFHCKLLFWSGDFEGVVAPAQELLDMASGVGNEQWIRLGEVFLAGARRDEAAIVGLIDAFRAAGQLIGLSFWHYLAAEAAASGGHPERALEHLERGLAFGHDHGEMCFLSCHYRLRGVLQAELGDVAAAEATLREGIEMAEAQEARLSVALMTAALCRVLRAAGRPDDALEQALRDSGDVLASDEAWPALVEAREIAAAGSD
ncbi:MAG: TOMM system kinase/cyclase fusion protein [Haliangiales bacterium]